MNTICILNRFLRRKTQQFPSTHHYNPYSDHPYSQQQLRYQPYTPSLSYEWTPYPNTINYQNYHQDTQQQLSTVFKEETLENSKSLKKIPKEINKPKRKHKTQSLPKLKLKGAPEIKNNSVFLHLILSDLSSKSKKSKNLHPTVVSSSRKLSTGSDDSMPEAQTQEPNEIKIEIEFEVDFINQHVSNSKLN